MPKTAHTPPLADGTIPPPVIEAERLRFSWPGASSQCLQIDRFALRRGERLLLLGPSGCGKSTLLGLLGGVLQPSAGTVHLLGGPFSACKPSERDRLRADHIGFIFQQLNLVPYLSLEDNVLLPCQFSPLRRRRAGNDPRRAARDLLHALELPETLWKRPVTDLSVGQQQRAAAARALIGTPELLIADEPSSALDGGNRDRLMQLLTAQLKAHEAALLVVSHDERLQPFMDRTVRMETLNAITSVSVSDSGLD
ncbi:MAG: ATP-binding cassette domain-containing protein [Lautropia sp.]|nr:ATP-binding cassette domain-containing protein [Lautropia sp.]